MKSLRISIVAIVTILISIGIVFIYSSSGVYAMQELGDRAYFLKRHVLFLFMSILAACGMMFVDYRRLRPAAKPMMIGTIVLLVLVLIPMIGQSSFGARRWFKVGVFHFQPSELAKFVMLIYAADFLARKRDAIKDFVEGFLPLICVVGINCLLVVRQPDLGNSILIASIVLIMMFVAGARLLHMGLLILASAPVVFLLVVKVSYRLKRIMSFLNPGQDVHGVGFQLFQSQIALGSGGIFGVGLGKSMQKLFYLPAAHTDFIFAIIGAELGLLGTLAVIILFGAFICQGARIAKRTQDPFGYYLSIGIVAMLGLQAVVNIGVSIGALPTKGLPLPFISYGGSALIFNMMAVGLLLNISRTEDL